MTEQEPIGFCICPRCGKTIEVFEGQTSAFHTCWGFQEMTEKEKGKAYPDGFKEKMQ